MTFKYYRIGTIFLYNTVFKNDISKFIYLASNLSKIRNESQ